MSVPLEQYGLLADMHTGPLVSRDGSIDWLCLPRFDSASVFTAILGKPTDGRWRLHVVDGEVIDWRYKDDTFILETTWRGPNGTARVSDFLPPSGEHLDLVRRVEVLSGEVDIEHDLRIRLNYGQATPLVREHDHQIKVVAGPDGILVTGPALSVHRPDALAPTTDLITGSLTLTEGQHESWQLIWYPSYATPPAIEDLHVDAEYERTVDFWESFSAKIQVSGPYAEQVKRSILVLQALTHSETGGIVAAPTASLPEDFGGERNWDYRYTWLRDASFTIEVLADHGGHKLAESWRTWLLRTIAGDPERLQIMYGVAGERTLPERELDHLSGYENSQPVRVGNGAVDQYQADVVGETMLALAKLRRVGLVENAYSWGLQVRMLEYCATHFDRPDHGIWEMRGDLHHFTHGRVMMWAAFNEGIKAVEEFEFSGDVDHWRELRDRLRAEIDERGFDPESNSFRQTYEGPNEVDASLLQLPQTGYLAADDPRMLGTVARIEKDLQGPEGFIHRYRNAAGLDGLAGEEYPFLICTFWLVEQYARSGRIDDAETLMDTLLGIANPLGLLAEEYDPKSKRLAGNYPQAFSHLALVRAADAITDVRNTTAD